MFHPLSTPNAVSQAQPDRLAHRRGHDLPLGPRFVAGPLHLRLTLACAMLGALLLASDLAARTLLHAQALPISIVTNSVGAMFVVALLLRRRR